MSEDDEWKRRAIQQDLAAHGLRAGRAGAPERIYRDEQGRVRLVERIVKSKMVKTHLTEDGQIFKVTITSVQAELREIKRQWDELAPKFTTEMLAKLVAILRAEDSTPRQTNAARLALKHIWRRRKDLRAAIRSAVPEMK